jgi:hypothetical protein
MSGYARDWVKYLTSDLIPEAAKSRYAERIVSMMSKLPSYSAPVILGGAGVNAITSNNEHTSDFDTLNSNNYLNYSK